MVRLNYKDVFKYMDLDYDDFIRFGEVRDFLANNGFYATDKEL